MMNITFATLFPDLTGVALQANFEMAAAALMVFSMFSSDFWENIAEPLEKPADGGQSS